MRKFITGIFLLVGIHGWGQADTLIEEDLRKAADIVFSKLDTSLYNGVLINRAFSTAEVTNQQLGGNDDRVHSLADFFELYADLSLAYVNSTQLMSNEELARFLETTFVKNESAVKNELIVPFGFVLHNVSLIDSTKLNTTYFTRDGFHLIPTGQEAEYYQKTILTSASPVEFDPESGYRTGTLQYLPELISTSPDITNLELELNVGYGFTPFNEVDNRVKYDRVGDSVVGLLAFTYELKGETYADTLRFYLTTKGEPKEKDGFGWDYILEYESSTGIDFEVGVLTGCGNETSNPRRPVIFVPPYRPFIQSPSMENYFNQFNIAGLFDQLTLKGYDVYFLKLEPGHRSLEDAAQALSEFIISINTLKRNTFPDESWENTVVGFSMGGQIARYCLKKMEYDHMVSGAPHHHTRLYIPFDSPHWGANIPLFTQAVYNDLKHLNIFAMLSYIALDDPASRDMSITHINGSVTSIEEGSSGDPDIYHILPGPTSARDHFMSSLNNSFNHVLSVTSDLRRTFPSFTRNVAVATGSNTKDYTELFSLEPGKLLFSQSSIGYYYGGTAYKLRRLHASKREYDHSVFRNKEQMLTFLIPITYRNRDYRVIYGEEWDMAQGGYKDEFYDKMTGAVKVLRLGTFGMGQKHYDNHMSFLPMVSALAINKELWQLGNLHYNIKNEGLMFNQFNFDPNIPSNTFGYPNLAHPATHFQITPFEAIYCDPQTYEHIKLQESVVDNSNDANNNDPVYLLHTARFLLDEIEADEVYLQNKVIGKNHVQWDATYRYRAWYKAQDKLTIGKEVTPKTDSGAYVIQPSGNITVYAGKEVHIKPGFHAQTGAEFHAYIDEAPCSRNKSQNNTSHEFPPVGSEPEEQTKIHTKTDQTTDREEISIYPNPASGEVHVVCSNTEFGDLLVFSYLGEQIRQQPIPLDGKLTLNLPKGHYLLRFKTREGRIVTKQLIIL